MIEKILSVQDVLTIGGLAIILIKIFQFWKEGKFRTNKRKTYFERYINFINIFNELCLIVIIFFIFIQQSLIGIAFMLMWSSVKYDKKKV